MLKITVVLCALGIVAVLGLLSASRLLMPGQSFMGVLPPLTATEKEIREKLQRHITYLAGDIGERNLHREYDNLLKAATYLRRQFKSYGYEVRSQPISVQEKVTENLEVIHRGNEEPEEIVLVGGHYDSITGSPGANDNATGVAALLVIAEMMHVLPTGKTVRFVAFTNEEPPYFQTNQMGSMQYAKVARQAGDSIVAMLSLETIGYYSDEPGSQRYPLPLAFLYPDKGNFIGFVGNLRARRLVANAVQLFRHSTAFPSEGAALPAYLPGVGWSDHWAFWQHGYQAIMLTDTALFRYPHYHTPKDTLDKVDYDRLARVVMGIMQVVKGLSDSEGGFP